VTVLRLLGGLVAWSQPTDDVTDDEDRQRWATLSMAELDVCLLVIAGLSNRDVAHTRGVTLRTQANLLYSASKKLAVHGRPELISRYAHLAYPDTANLGSSH
jgi:DNA-binding CsgD family transcriptional regulator